MKDIINVILGMIGAFLPLLCSGLLPNGYQRWAAAMFAAAGIFVFAGHMTNPNPSPFAVGIDAGFVLATAKLTTGLPSPGGHNGELYTRKQNGRAAQREKMCQKI